MIFGETKSRRKQRNGDDVNNLVFPISWKPDLACRDSLHSMFCFLFSFVFSSSLSIVIEQQQQVNKPKHVSNQINWKRQPKSKKRNARIAKKYRNLSFAKPEILENGFSMLGFVCSFSSFLRAKGSKSSLNWVCRSYLVHAKNILDFGVVDVVVVLRLFELESFSLFLGQTFV